MLVILAAGVIAISTGGKVIGLTPAKAELDILNAKNYASMDGKTKLILIDETGFTQKVKTKSWFKGI